MRRLLITLAFCATIPLSACSQASVGPIEGFEPLILSQEPTPQATQNQDPQAQEYATDPSAEIDIYSQSGDGKSVKIHEIHVGRGNAFLVIYDSTGLVLAESLTTPQSQPVTIELDYPLTNSQSLQAALYLDNGDGIFELDQDFPILGEDSKLVHQDFDYKLEN